MATHGRIAVNRLLTKKTSLLLATLLAVVVLGPAVAQTAPNPSASENADDREPPYSIGIGDVLGISVWKNEELQATVPVRPDGRISLLLIGDVDVAGLTTDQVRLALTTRYEEFVNAPGVSVMVTEINSRKIYVLGEIMEPGAYDLVRPTRLLQALAMAGGLTEFAKKDHVILFRDVAGERRRYELNLKRITSGAELASDVLLESDDTIFVP